MIEILYELGDLEMNECVPKFKATVKMKKPWTDEYAEKPSLDMVLEAFGDEILRGRVDDLFEVIIEEITNKTTKNRKRFNP